MSGSLAWSAITDVVFYGMVRAEVGPNSAMTGSRRGMATKTRQVRSLDATGNEMRVENTITTPRGERKITQLFTKSGGA